VLEMGGVSRRHLNTPSLRASLIMGDSMGKLKSCLEELCSAFVKL
jgi:hypothetical protein